MKLHKFISLALLGCLMGSCRYIDYHPYDVDVTGPRNVNGNNLVLIETQCRDADTIIFAATGDTQGWYDETEDFVADVNKNHPEVMFVVHTGDLTDYGTLHEFEWQRNILGKLQVPYVCDLGNHDCLGTGKETFEAMFGNPNFSFIAGNVKFVNINTNALEYDYSEAVPDLDYIEKQVTDRDSAFSRTVVTMHAKPFSDVFNNNVANAFERHYLAELPGLMFCLNGHDHKPGQFDLFGDGLIYYQTASIDKREYYIFTITPSGYSYEVIHY